MMRILLAGFGILLVAGCQPPVPDSRTGGVGFESYSEYQERRFAEAQARAAATTPPAPAPIIAPPAPYGANTYGQGTPGTGAPSASELAQAGIGSAPISAAPPMTGSAPISSAAPAYDATAYPANIPPANPGVAESTAYYPGAQTTQPVQEINNSGISDEQDFSAVASRETIQSDKERLAQNRAVYQQVQPTDLPERTGDSSDAVDLVQYALKAPNRLGEPIYARSQVSASKTASACARFSTTEAAQQAFLKAGGPKRDPKGLDPDGDGFACYWDPTPFQKARG